MTIKEFSEICNCNPQTLRYYDSVDLLKPVKVDSFSGYRYYAEEQAYDFVKIKNLQEAGFSLTEIKELLHEEDDVVYRAFDKKITELNEKLKKLKNTQQTYRAEMNQMKKQVTELLEKINEVMQGYDAEKEFGLDAEGARQVADAVGNLFEAVMTDVPEVTCSEEDEEFEDEEFDWDVELTQNPQYETIYEKHNWSYAKEFLDEIPCIEENEAYAIYLKVTKDENERLAFANTMLGIILEKNGGKHTNIGCSVTPSEDETNHFWLLKRK